MTDNISFSSGIRISSFSYPRISFDVISSLLQYPSNTSILALFIPRSNVVNHTMAVHICLDYFRWRSGAPPPVVVEDEIAENILPVKDNKRDRRKIKTKEAACFFYRVAQDKRNNGLFL